MFIVGGLHDEPRCRGTRSIFRQNVFGKLQKRYSYETEQNDSSADQKGIRQLLSDEFRDGRLENTLEYNCENGFSYKDENYFYNTQNVFSYDYFFFFRNYFYYNYMSHCRAVYVPIKRSISQINI